MLSGLKFIPRNQIDKTLDEKVNDSNSRKSYKKKKKSHHGGSSDDGSQRIKKRSRKKWYSSEENSSSYSDASESGSEQDTRIRRKSKGEKKRHKRRLDDEEKGKLKKSGRREYSSDDDCAKEDKVVQKDHKKRKGRLSKDSDGDMDGNCGVSHSTEKENIVRKEMGLEWMLRPKDNMDQKSASTSDLLEEAPAKEIKKANPRELNPYFNNDGSGYPEEADGASSGGSNLLSNAVVGDGGASWRLKALKRAQEQAAREGKKLDEVVGERWGSLGKLAVSVASASAAPSHAHLHAIKNRIRLQTREQQTTPADRS
ncbi:hypothetical protein Ccrd_022359, partial [Cynara cardunculus var. scolymus]